MTPYLSVDETIPVQEALAGLSGMMATGVFSVVGSTVTVNGHSFKVTRAVTAGVNYDAATPIQTNAVLYRQ